MLVEVVADEPREGVEVHDIRHLDGIDDVHVLLVGGLEVDEDSLLLRIHL